VRERAIVIATAVLARLLCLALFDPAASLASGDSAAFLAGSATQAPGYPAFLAVTGPLALLIQSAATIGVALLAQSRLPRGGTLAALLIVSSPFIIAFEYRILSDTLAWQLIFAAFLLIVFPRAKWEIMLAGVLLGCAALVRDTYQWLPLFALPFAFAQRKGKRMASAAAIALLVLLPWQLSQGRASISEGRMGYNLWIGTWERNNDWMAKGIDGADYPPGAFSSSAQQQWLLEKPLFSRDSDQRFRAAALDRIRSAPLETAATWALRYPRLWLGTRTDQIAWRLDSGPLWYGLKGGLWALNLFCLGLGAIGIFLCGRRYPLFLAPVLYVALVYVPFHNTETRYSLGALPFIFIFASLAAQQTVPGRLMEIVDQRLHALRQLLEGNRRRVEARTSGGSRGGAPSTFPGSYHLAPVDPVDFVVGRRVEAVGTDAALFGATDVEANFLLTSEQHPVDAGIGHPDLSGRSAGGPAVPLDDAGNVGVVKP
jgi:hypothetical protein